MFKHYQRQMTAFLLIAVLGAAFTRIHPLEAAAIQVTSTAASELSGTPAVDWIQLVYKQIFAAKISARRLKTSARPCVHLRNATKTLISSIRFTSIPTSSKSCARRSARFAM